MLAVIVMSQTGIYSSGQPPPAAEVGGQKSLLQTALFSDMLHFKVSLIRFASFPLSSPSRVMAGRMRSRRIVASDPSSGESVVL